MENAALMTRRMNVKARLDCLLVEQGFALSREKAKRMIKSGSVYVNGQKEEKAGSCFEPAEIQIEIRGDVLKYVSRGGLKLEKACVCWKLPIEGGVCMDIGASTGGFTDCMLQNGAARVYAVDAGVGQLSESLKKDARVVNLEKTNFRYLTEADIGEKADFAGADVSFISLTRILLPARKLLKDGGEMVCLIKPQFEAGKGMVGKNGVVRDISVHRKVIERIIDFAAGIGFDVLHLEYSPIKGPEGNIEYLLHLRKNETKAMRFGIHTEEEAEANLQKLTAEAAGESQKPEWKALIMATVQNAHKSLGKKGPGT